MLKWHDIWDITIWLFIMINLLTLYLEEAHIWLKLQWLLRTAIWRWKNYSRARWKKWNNLLSVKGSEKDMVLLLAGELTQRILCSCKPPAGASCQRNCLSSGDLKRKMSQTERSRWETEWSAHNKDTHSLNKHVRPLVLPTLTPQAGYCHDRKRAY